MKYRWEAVFERAMITMTEDGELESYQRLKRKGEMDENEAGANVVRALLDDAPGNIVYLEVERIG